MTRKILKANGKVVYRLTVWPLSPDKMADKTMAREREKYNESVERLHGDSLKYKDFSNNPELESLGTPLFEPYKDDKGSQIPVPRNDNDKTDPNTYEQYVDAKVVLLKGDVMMNAKVRGLKRQANGTLLGKAHTNPILNTGTYKVEFADGQLTELTANIIAEKAFAQCDSEGNQYLLLAAIVNHRNDSSAVEKKDMYIKRGYNLQLRRTTKGWILCVEWNDRSTP
jgi:hypothetical protein